MEDSGATGILDVTNAAEVLQLLGALLIILAAYGSVARDREDGTLRRSAERYDRRSHGKRTL